MRKKLSLLIVVVLFVFGISSVMAINYGDPDGNGHPYVGIMVAKNADGNPLWRCSGTLISPTVYLTAGHCTESPAAIVEIWFEPEIVAGLGWPFGGPTSVTGTPHTHPSYVPGAFFLYDLGVVVLDEPVVLSEYGALPQAGIIDTLATRRGQQDTTITAVGYGLQRVRSNPAGPDFTLSDLRREVAVLNLVNSRGVAGIPRGTSIFVSGNANTGGTCYGDSGGPLFLNNTNVVVAVTSFGLNGNCAGVGGGYRVDMPDDLNWVASFLP